LRSREYLTEAEITRLRKAASLRDSTMILLAYRHGLRVSELVALEWADVQDLGTESRASLTVRRLKGSLDGTHPLEPDEVAALRKLLRERVTRGDGSIYLFPSARGGKMTPAAFRKQLSRIADAAGLGALKVHPHMLRHTCGQALVDQMPLGMLADYLGHAQIQNTRIYSRANGERFRGIWRRRRK
jgi:type 1 fimbriae regulatory protein FimB/type 1 fimbriae regulatory protein FimE